MGCLRSFWAIRNLKFHFFSSSKRLKPITRNPCIVNENIVSIGLFDKSKSLLRIKPLHKPFCQFPYPPLKKISEDFLIALIKKLVKI
jgi:hypothetical protein